jgi:hypothetical protein
VQLTMTVPGEQQSIIRACDRRSGVAVPLELRGFSVYFDQLIPGACDRRLGCYIGGADDRWHDADG